MTKHYRTKQIDALELVSITCDRCGKDIPLPGPTEIREFKLEFTRGKKSATFDAPDQITGWQVPDLCDDCLGVLSKLLEENAFHPKPIE